jgi:hypothetical protein
MDITVGLFKKEIGSDGKASYVMIGENPPVIHSGIRYHGFDHFSKNDDYFSRISKETLGVEVFMGVKPEYCKPAIVLEPQIFESIEDMRETIFYEARKSAFYGGQIEIIEDLFPVEGSRIGAERSAS